MTDYEDFMLVYLKISGLHCDPNEISRKLSLEEKGRPGQIDNKKISSYQKEVGSWVYYSKLDTNNIYVDEHINDIFNSIPNLDPIKGLYENISFVCVSEIHISTPAWSFESEIIRKLALWDCDLEIESSWFRHPEPDDEED